MIFPDFFGFRYRFRIIYNDFHSFFEQTINQHLEEIASVYADGQFLVGDQLTRADLAACAFLAPTFMPVEYGIDWPDISRFPLEMRDWLAAHQEQVNVVGAVYRANRRKNA